MANADLLLLPLMLLPAADDMGKIPEGAVAPELAPAETEKAATRTGGLGADAARRVGSVARRSSDREAEVTAVLLAI